jgi:hypothetical protein
MLKILYGEDSTMYDNGHKIFTIHPALDECINYNGSFTLVVMPNINNLNMIWKDFRVSHLTNITDYAIKYLLPGANMIITGITDPFMIDIITEIGFVKCNDVYLYTKPVIEEFKTIGVQNNENAEIADIQQCMADMSLNDIEYNDTEMCDNYLDTLDIDDLYIVEDMYRGYDD